MEPTLDKKPSPRRKGSMIAGLILILIGVSALLQHWFDIDSYLVLLLGVALLAWGALVHRTGLIIPGGVLTGIGLGILAMEGPWTIPGADPNGMFLLCFAAGWFLITLLTALFTCTQWWALIPGGIMAILGGSLLVTNGGVRWEDLNLVYAGLLIVGGLALLISHGRANRKE